MMSKPYKKTILAVWNTADKGKTETLREFARLLLRTYPSCRPIYPIPLIIPSNYDFRIVVEINGIIIGIESQGDPKTNLHNRLIDLADNPKFKCDLILCSTRTKGDTVYAVDNLANTRGFETIWTSTYQVDNRANHNLVNQLKAKHLLDLLQGLGLL